MADLYHNLTYHNSTSGLPSPADGMLSYEEFLDELQCFNGTLEAVPSRPGQLFLILLYSCTSFVALLGNVTVIVVELLGSESAVNIRKYLINLAVSDIIIGVLCVPFTYTDFMLGQWIFPHWLCPTAQYVQLLSVFVTSLTLTIIGVERYMATLHPFSNIHRWLECHTHIMLWLTWVLGALYAYIPIANTYTRPFTHEGATYYECSYDNEISILKRRLFVSFNFILTFLLPLVVLICSYSAIMCKLLADQRRSQRCNNPHQQPQPQPQPQQPRAAARNDSTRAESPEATIVTTECTANYSSSQQSPEPQSSLATVKPTNKTQPKVPRAAAAATRRRLTSVVPKKFFILRPRKLFNVSMSSPPPKTTNGPKTHTNSGNKKSNISADEQTTQQTANSNGALPVSPIVAAIPAAHSPATGRNSVSEGFSLRKSVPNNNHSKTIKMMFTVILLYGICWMPIKLYQFLLDYGLISYCTEWQLYALVTLYFVCHWIAMANSFVNPIVYSFMSRSFRNDFRRITNSFRASCRGSPNSQSASLKTISTHV